MAPDLHTVPSLTAHAGDNHPDSLQRARSESSTLTSAAKDSAQSACQPQSGPMLAEDCWVLSGPTAAGKTALAIALANRLNAEIISVDSMAVYTGLDIGTAKPTRLERHAVPHHLIDMVTPSELYSVARWLADAGRAVDAIRAAGRNILFVGGTPLYLRALRDGLAPLPAADQDFRNQLLAEISGSVSPESGSKRLHARLAIIDPTAATRIHPHDTRRIIRALEVAHCGKRLLSESFAPDPHPIFSQQMMIIDVPRSLLNSRIDQRVENMFAEGLIAEVRAAVALPGGIGFTARQAAGYTESLDFLAGRIPLADAIRQTQQRTRQLAKRQLTWLRSFKNAVWIAA